MRCGITRTITVPLLLALLLALPPSGVATPGAAAGGLTGGKAYAAGDSGPDNRTKAPGTPREDSYEAYIASFVDREKPAEEVLIEAEAYSAATGVNVRVLRDFAGLPGASLWTDETGSVEWKVRVPKDGLYQLAVRYYPVEGKSAAIERQLLLDGRVPFSEANGILFGRVWANEAPDIARDNRGNDIRPKQAERPIWQETVVRDAQGYYERPFQFYVTAGEHTITLVSVREPMVVRSLRLFREPEPPAYAELAREYEKKGLRPIPDTLTKVQGEAAVRKSDPTLYPLNDRSSPATEPYDVSKIRMNTIGGHNWRLPGQWIEWEVEAPRDGLYRLAFKSRQNGLRGLYSTRKLTIDGNVPFREAESLRFLYGRDWKLFEPGDEGKRPYWFHLTPGKHTIRLEVTLGDIAPLIRTVEHAVLELNALYRQIIKITGTSPDPYRDYRLDRQIPRLTERFREQSELLTGVAGELERLTGEKSDKVAALHTAAYQLNDFAERPETIQHRLGAYQTNVGSLGTWMLTVREQPLEIDYLLLAGEGAKLPKEDVSWLAKAKHEVLSFVYSFLEDYNSIGDVSGSGDAVTVWIGTGRDQAQSLKSMIDDTFTPATGIRVNLKLVQMGVLLPATLAGQGPDVAMQIGNETPVNFAMRGAAYDVSAFADYPQVAGRFRDSAIVPYRYGERVFALPEQQTFPMLFYRKDVLDGLKLNVPDTWDDVYRIIPVLQKNAMQFALPLEQNFARMPTMAPNAAFAALLFQNDGDLYDAGGRRSGLDSEPAMLAFKRWTDMYTGYKMPLTFDFANRFRTGEMPIGIADYSLYNHLSVSAPEIRGLWEFAPIPGTPTAGGIVRREAPGGGTAIMMLNGAKNKANAWTFMKWWTGKEAQVRFGREMEGLMGAAARYPTANVAAMAELPWPAKDYARLERQWEWVKGVPEVPGGYFTGRHLDNAFREVVNRNRNARETLYDYTSDINEEIALKRGEFGLPE
ncbi:extracellular solute-binding protein [Paenibacillus hodogayensis]|uniref:Extracellular solute-binding protein n=1 Tax=Paenibacillus hodogayensis TaxID=279208 RepID=A0ABV5VYF8_9BACL